MNFLRKIQYSQYWNIGFCEQAPMDLIRDKHLKSIRWMKHPFRDRWFADPFILKANNNDIVVFVEECSIENPKGIICELVIDRRTMRLKKRYVMLELDTHLSYPAILHYQGRVYVYPENGASGKLNVYEYDENNHRLINPVCILEEAVADATIVKSNGCYYMSATKYPNTQEGAFLYWSEHCFDRFRQVGGEAFQIGRHCSRQGGDWIIVNEKLYRPAQDCVKRYGSALSIMEMSNISECDKERFCFSISPNYYRYPLGVHTINFKDNLCVVDGYGYYYPLLGRLYYNSLIRAIIRR